jgi:hypothetical protein
MWLSTLWPTTPRRLLIDVSQVGVVREMAASFHERAEWCSRLETSGSRVCDLVLGPMDGRVHLAARLEEVARQLKVMQDEHQALQNLVTRVQNLVLDRSGETPSLAAALSSTMDLVKHHVDAADCYLVTFPRAGA